MSVIVVNWNTRELLRGCLTSIARHLVRLPHEVIVVDNGSSDGSAEMVSEQFSAARLIRNTENVGFGRANNTAMAVARGEYCLLLNSDAELLDDGPSRLVEQVRGRSEVGVAALQLVHADGRPQVTARRFPTLGLITLGSFWLYRLLPRRRAAAALLGQHWDHGSEREADWVTGACMIVRRDVFEKTGGFDPAMFLYGEELEWCHRVREQGWKVLFSPIGRVLHLDHQSADKLLGVGGRLDRCLLAEDRLIARWHGRVTAGFVMFVRVLNALSRLAAFRVRALLGHDDDYGRDARDEARWLLGHYRRRLLGT